jgi:hypothetical protein
MSESPEFFWSKIRREIERRGDEQIEVPEPSLTLADWLGQHGPAMLTVVATVVVVLTVFRIASPNKPGPANGGSAAGSSFAKVQQVSTTIPNTTATAFNSREADATVIWISGLPWTSNMDEMKDEFDNLEI